MVDYAGTPAASARLAGMAFLFSYTIASFGPGQHGRPARPHRRVHRDLGHLTVLMLAQVGLLGRSCAPRASCKVE